MKLLTLFIALAPLLAYGENSFKVDLPHNKTLEIQIPKTHKLGFKDTSNGLTCEFIPENESIDDWSEIVTVLQVSNCNELMVFLSNMQTKKNASEKPADLLRNDISFGKENGILLGNHILDQPSFLLEKNEWKLLNDTNEFFYMRAIQGTNEVWTVQYSKRYPRSKTSSKDKAKFLNKMEMFMNEAISIQDK